MPRRSVVSKRTVSARRRPCAVAGRALVLCCCAGAWGDAQLAADHAAVQAFLGGTDGEPVRAVVVFSNGDNINYAKLDDDPLRIRRIAGDGRTDYRSINISPDGRHVAYATGRKVYVRPVEENAGKRLSVGAGTFPTWWVHPRTKKWYVLYQNASSADVYIREVDMPTFTAVGEAKLLVERIVITKPGQDPADLCANGGRSYDGRFMTGDDALHGTIELEDPLATANAKIKAITYYTSLLHYSIDASTRPYNAWCNANIAPAKEPRSPYYGCVQHMGAGHTDMYIRRWPRDVARVSAVDSNYNPCPRYVYEPAMPHYCDADDVAAHFRPKDGNTHYHGTFWSTHESYICAKESRDKNAGSWYGYIYDVSSGEDGAYIRVLSKGLNKGNDFLHLWVDETAVRARTERDGAEEPKSRTRLLRGPRTLAVSGTDNRPVRLSLVRLDGTVVRWATARRRAVISLEGLAPGIHVLRIYHGGECSVRAIAVAGQ